MYNVVIKNISLTTPTDIAKDKTETWAVDEKLKKHIKKSNFSVFFFTLFSIISLLNNHYTFDIKLSLRNKQNRKISCLAAVTPQ